MRSATLQLETLTCPSCVAKIEGALKHLDGVDEHSTKILFNSSKVKLDFNEDTVSIDDIKGSIDKLGFEVLKSTVK